MADSLRRRFVDTWRICEWTTALFLAVFSSFLFIYLIASGIIEASYCNLDDTEKEDKKIGIIIETLTTMTKIQKKTVRNTIEVRIRRSLG